MHDVSGGNPPRILVVDDDESIREVLAAFLSDAGMVVETAADGMEALEMFQRRRPDAVLLDVMMPFRDGYETCFAIRQLPGAEYVPVLMATALDDTESIERAYEVGASNFISKPINWTNLTHQLRYALRSSQAFADLRKSEERYALAARGANDGLWDWDLGTDEVHFSPRWKAMLGYAEDAVGTKSGDWFDRVHPEDRARVEGAITRHLVETSAPELEVEHRIRAADGSYRWVLCRGVAIHDARGRPSRMAGSQTDISARKQAEAQLLHDPVTGLPNRSLFLDRVAHRLKLTRKKADSLFAVLLMDVDRLQVVNDSLGHDTGDLLLRGLGERIQSCLGPTDTLSRLGGDEFTVLVDEVTDVASVTRLVERLQSTLNKSFQLEGHEVVVTASIGIALSSSGYETAEDVLRDSDTAMHRAKALGKARYQVFDQDMHAQALTVLQLESELRAAIERQEFRLVYQPMVALASNTLVGFEALLRWQHPERGLASPASFLPVAADAGLLVPIGRWVLGEACRQMREWQEQWDEARRWSVSVNVSASELADPDFLATVDGALSDSGLPAKCLTVEVAEATLRGHSGPMREVLMALHERGIQTSIDDFGIGSSSFRHLNDLPFDVVKIDGSFVTGMEKGGKHLEIVKAMVALAHSLGMTVVAEGSENRQDVLKLRQMACEVGQGHVFAQPMEGEAVEELMSQKLARKADAS